jgi:dTDP-4-amino-4,6-dideoxygalactose transaminase
MTGSSITLTNPCLAEDDFRAMEHAIRCGAITEGSIARSFEEDFAGFLGVAGAVATNSCTSALVLALATLDIGPGDEVALPSYTCLAVLNAVVQAGALPRLADNRYDVLDMDYNIAIESLKLILSPRTRAIIVPHMFGTPANMDVILNVGLPVIEDITLSLGATYRNKPVGAWGDISVCSFHASKMIACGEGGILASKDPAILKRARYLNGWADEQAAARLSDRVEPYRLRYNFHMSDVAAALGKSQLQKLPSFIARRRKLARQYTERLARVPGVRTPEANRPSSVFHRYLVAVQRETVVSRIERFAAANIEAGRGVYPPLHRYLGQAVEMFPGAEQAVGSLVSIPIYPSLTDQQVESLLQVSEKVLSSDWAV